MVDIKRLLRPDDKQIINATGATSWVPPNPRDILLPYMEEPEDLNSVDSRRQKAQEVYEGYGTLIENCKELEDEIANRCKDATVDLDEEKHFATIEAIERVFGVHTTKITFQMYQTCIAEIAKIGNDFKTSRG
jgi:hypothetical protein